MASLDALLERAVSESSVRLDPASQEAIFALSARSPELRAALARRPDLDEQLREPLSKDDSIECRSAFLSRSDLSDEEIATLVGKERRTTLLKNVAKSSTDPDLLTVLAKKGGQGLQRLVAFNPVTPDAVRLASTRVAFKDKSEVHYRDRHQVLSLLADSPSVLRWAFESDEALAMRSQAISFLPYVHGDGGDVSIDAGTVFEGTMALLEETRDEWVRTYHSNRYSDIASALVEVAWLFTPAQRARLCALLDAVVQKVPDWRAHSVRAARDRIVDSAKLDKLEVDSREARRLLDVCRESTDGAELAAAAATIRSGSGMYSSPSAASMLASLALVRNPAAPLATLYSMSTMSGSGVTTLVAKSAVGSPRLAALLLASGRELPEAVAASVTFEEVFEAAAAEQFWPRSLLSALLQDPATSAKVLSEAPVGELPSELSPAVLQQLVELLGERTADRQWLEMTLSLSTSWSGRLSDLVELADHI